MIQQLEDLLILKEKKDNIFDKLRVLETDSFNSSRENTLNKITTFNEKFDNCIKDYSAKAEAINEVSLRFSKKINYLSKHLEEMKGLESELDNLFLSNECLMEGELLNDSINIFDNISTLFEKQKKGMDILKSKRDSIVDKLNMIKNNSFFVKSSGIESDIVDFTSISVDLKNELEETLSSLGLINKEINEASPELESYFYQLESLGKEFKEILEEIDKCNCSVDDYMAKVLLTELTQLENDISNLLDIQKNKGLNYDYFSNLTKNKTMNLFIMGGFSVGKTTFIKRLLGQASGAIAPTPQTGAMIEHYRSNIRNLSIFFNNEIVKSKKGNEKIYSFIEKYDLEKNFKFQEKGWQFTGNSDVVFDNIPVNKSLQIINELDSCHNIVDKISWGHKEKNPYSLLNYLNIYDFPGFEGAIEHEEKIMGYMKEYKPDLLVYLLDINRGVPSEKELNSLIKTLDIFISKEIKPNFFWCYQKEDKTSFISSEEFKEKAGNILLETVEGITSDSSNILQIKEILKGAPILDCRGSEKDKKRANLGVVNALSYTFVDKCNDFFKALENQHIIFTNTLDIMNEVYDYKSYISTRINKLLKKDGVISWSDLEIVVNDIFKINELATLKKLLEKETNYESLINRIDGRINKLSKFTLKVMKLFNKGRTKFSLFKDYSNEPNQFIFDYDYVKNNFFFDLKEENQAIIVEWIDLVHESHLLISFLKNHSKVLLNEYYKDIENRMVDQIKNKVSNLSLKLKL